MWLAVTTMPASQLSSLTAKESIGVGISLSYRCAVIPLAASTHAAVCANSSEHSRESYAMATFLPPFAFR